MRLVIMVLANVCNVTRLERSFHFNRLSIYPVEYRSFCPSTCFRHPRVQCIPCCAAGGAGTNWEHRPGMIERLGHAYRSILDMHNATHILKIDDDTRVNYANLAQFIEHHPIDPKVVYGNCIYDHWIKYQLCTGGAGTLTHHGLVRKMLRHWPRLGADDVEFSRSAIAAGGRLEHVSGFNHECDLPFETHITLHHCK
jgi:hypothetical protein